MKIIRTIGKGLFLMFAAFVIALCLTLLHGCVVGPFDFEGKLCNTENLCPSEYFCNADGMCQLDCLDTEVQYYGECIPACEALERQTILTMDLGCNGLDDECMECFCWNHGQQFVDIDRRGCHDREDSCTVAEKLGTDPKDIKEFVMKTDWDLAAVQISETCLER